MNRRRLADETMRMVPGELIVQGDAVAQFIEGSVEVEGRVLTWQTLGAYRTDPAAGLVREVWLVPLDGDLFDRIWSAAGASEPKLEARAPAGGPIRGRQEAMAGA